MSTYQAKLQGPSGLARALEGKIMRPRHSAFDGARQAWSLAIDLGRGRRRRDEAINVIGSRQNLTQRRLRRNERSRDENADSRPTLYGLTLVLAGITAEDYLQWIRDPEASAGIELTLVSAHAASLGDRIELELLVHGEPPSHRAAATAVGFPITPEVIGIHRTPLPASTQATATTPR
jgi:hypothetical protein